MSSLKKVNIAIVCDWLTTQGGAEKVILGLSQLFPNAPIYTALYDPQKVKGFEDKKVITSYLQKIPYLNKKHQLLLSFLPRAFESFDLSEYDIIISSSHSCAKGVLTKPETMHVCYCHSPMRYAWDNYQQYINEYSTNFIIKKTASFLMHNIRIWDRISADRVDYFISNSNYIAKRIAKFYRRQSTTIYPFINTDKFKIGMQKNFFMAVGRMTPYKKFDLIVDAFNKNGLPIKIAGIGGQLKSLKSKAKSNIEFLGFVSDEELIKMYGAAKALIFPQSEDFGIIPLEAMSSGCPVIAYGKGGALETIIDNKTGVLFEHQTTDSLNDAIDKLSGLTLNRNEISQHAASFDQEVFNNKLIKFLERNWEKHQLNNNT